MSRNDPVIQCWHHRTWHVESAGCSSCKTAERANNRPRLIPNPDGSLSWAVEDQARRNSQDALDLIGAGIFRALEQHAEQKRPAVRLVDDSEALLADLESDDPDFWEAVRQ